VEERRFSAAYDPKVDAALAPMIANFALQPLR
jgi:hypothetical protein